MIVCNRCKCEINKEEDQHYTIKIFRHNDPLDILKLSEDSLFKLCNRCYSRTMKFASDIGYGKSKEIVDIEREVDERND